MLLLANVFGNFRRMCLEIYHFDPAKYVSVPRFAWKAALKKNQVELDLIIDIDMLLMIEKGIRGGIYNAIHHYAKANNKYMDDYDENKESLYINYWDVNYLYEWAMSHKLPLFNFEWVDDTSQFNEVFIKNYDEKKQSRLYF